MAALKNNKGIAILLVSALSLIICIGIIAILFALRSNAQNLESFKERALAYYLCETGASVAILDIAHGRVGTGATQWTERTFNYPIGTLSYPVNYKITKTAGQWIIVASVNAQAGFKHTYKLKVGGTRSFPVFIRGFAGK